MSEERKSLVALHQEHAQLAEHVVDLMREAQAPGTEELAQEALKALDTAAEQLCCKIDAYGVVDDRLDAQAEFWKEQAKVCAETGKVFENARRRLRDRMKFVLSTRPEGERELQGEFFRYSLSKGRPALEIDDLRLPNQYKRAHTEFRADREKIEAAVARGEIPDGVVVREVMTLRQGRPKA